MYKTQIACAIFILFIGILYFRSAENKTKSSRNFIALLVCSFIQLIFDVLSVYTVNHLETVSPILNRIIHIVFLGLLQALFYIGYLYLETIIEEEIGKSIGKYRYTVIPLLLTTTGTIFLPLYYVESKRSNYSYGPAVYMIYVGVAVYLFLIIRLLFQYRNSIPRKKKLAIYVALLSEVPVTIYQIAVPDSLITCIGIVMFNLGIYMTTENPDALLVEQLEKEKRRADSANAAKTNFLANMSHEIRTPITAVLGMNELILRESEDKTIKQYAKDIEGAAKSLLSIINDILDITKIEAGKLSVISIEYDLGTVIKDVVNMISFKAKVKGLEFAVLVDENIPRKLVGDDIRLRQILVNLLNNAVKYTHEGKVTLEVTGVFSDVEKNVTLHFCVKDTGIGIKEEDLQKLCEPFERLEEKRNRNIEGTGLGMSITKQLLNLLDSELKISSVYGVGSEFSFDLKQKIVDETPLGRIEERTETETKESRNVFAAPNAKILFVDDNELNRKVFMGLLKPTKIQIDEAENGRACLEKVMKNAYDIIFMDHMMPELDGVETFRIMREMESFPSKNTPVVILTANALVGAKEKYLQEGFADFLEKPIDYEKLENVIRNLLDKSLWYEVKEPVMKSSIADMELPIVEGVDWKYAQMHFRDKKMMLEAVSFFVESIDYEADALRKLFVNIDTEIGRKNFCTKIHSMKNTASTIGIIPLAGMAKVLEDAARNNEVDILKAMTPIFIEKWCEYREKMPGFIRMNQVENKKDAKDFKCEIQELIRNINIAAKEMDIDTLDSIWVQLSEYYFEDKSQEVVEQIHQAINAFDVDYLQGVDSDSIFIV